MKEGYSIKETSELTGMSEDTIRYYEKIGLLPRAQRKQNSHRIYSNENIETMRLMICLKKTGMSLDEMRPFLNISLNSDLAQYPELYEKIQSHKQNILEQIASLQQIVDFIDTKVGLIGRDNQACGLSGDRKRMPARSPRADEMP
ncbi:MerR family transcriptional regulator [Paenibacillus sp. PK3_47]|nr:MerR family transcriptional regulator [Paenibacillus sp. PK3_47]